MNSIKRIALVGNPNCGKTTLFNALTGLRHKVANYAGVTVERRLGIVHLPPDQTAELIDLPGTYSLTPTSADEALCVDFLNGHCADESLPDVIIAVVDATHLTMNLRLVLELRRYAKPMVVALNMFDLAQAQGLSIDIPALSEALGCPVIPTTAVSTQAQNGCAALIETIQTIAETKDLPPPRPLSAQTPSLDQELTQILKRCAPRTLHIQRFSCAWDRWLLHPLVGMCVLFLVLGLMFQAIFVLAAWPSDAIRSAFDALGTYWSRQWPSSLLLPQLLIKGVLPGTGLALSFLPQVALLFFFIIALESCGYLPRAAFLLDGIMGRVGLSGRAFIPLLSSFACAVPGIVATRTIANPRERLVTILIAPLITCSARLQVYALLIGAFVPHRRWGGLDLQGLVLLGLYLLGLMGAWLVAGVLNHWLSRAPEHTLLMELPAYHWPRMRDVAVGVWEKTGVFIQRIITIIPPLGAVLWFLCNYPAAPMGAQGPAIRFSWAGQLADALSGLWIPLGFNREIAIALIPGLWAREIAIGSLATVYSVQATDSVISLSTLLTAQWAPATGYALLVWYVFAPQCLSTLVVIQKETRRWWPPVFALIYLFSLAYIAAYMTYHVTLWFT
jgi:ferrous iron transport protein B